MKTKDKNQKIKVSKSKRIEIRVGLEFFNDLNSKIKYSGLSQSEFLRQNLSQTKIVVKKDYNNLAIQVRKVGVNLNEIAYSLNVANLKNVLNNYDYQALFIVLQIKIGVRIICISLLVFQLMIGQVLNLCQQKMNKMH